jgi:hypothetical protein
MKKEKERKMKNDIHTEKPCNRGEMFQECRMTKEEREKYDIGRKREV